MLKHFSSFVELHWSSVQSMPLYLGYLVIIHWFREYISLELSLYYIRFKIADDCIIFINLILLCDFIM